MSDRKQSTTQLFAVHPTNLCQHISNQAIKNVIKLQHNLRRSPIAKFRPVSNSERVRRQRQRLLHCNTVASKVRISQSEILTGLRNLMLNGNQHVPPPTTERIPSQAAVKSVQSVSNKRVNDTTHSTGHSNAASMVQSGNSLRNSPVETKSEDGNEADKTDLIDSDISFPAVAAYDPTKMLNVTISTIMLLASGHTAIPIDYYMWTELFLKTIKDDQGQHHINVQNLLNYMKVMRARYNLTWIANEKVNRTSSSNRQSRIPVAKKTLEGSTSQVQSHISPSDPSLSILRRQSNVRAFETTKPSKIISPSGMTETTQIDDAFRAYYMAMARQPGFNKIIHRLIFAENAPKDAHFVTSMTVGEQLD